MKLKKIFYNANIKSHFDYASTVWDGAADLHIKQLNSLQRRAAKIILPNIGTCTDDKLEKLKILPLNDQLKFNKGVLMFKVKNNHVPNYLTNLFHRNTSRYQNYKNRFSIPQARVDLFKTSFSFSGSFLWNSLPMYVTSSASLTSFKDNLRKFLLSEKKPP